MSKQPTRGIQIEAECEHCKGTFKARLADIRRGWGKYCSKPCKARAQAERQRAEAEPTTESKNSTGE